MTLTRTVDPHDERAPPPRGARDFPQIRQAGRPG